MKKTAIVYGISIFLLSAFLLLSGCQRVFTFSPFSGLQRDPATMSAEQQQRYALDVLASGDTAAMAEAYALVEAMLANDPGNGGLHLLAADLAIGASGLGGLVSSIDPESGFSDAAALTEGLNTGLLSGVDSHIQQAEASGQDISDSQYVNAGAAIIIAKAAESEDGFDGIDWENDEDVIRAKGYAETGGVDIEALFGGGAEETEETEETE